jgi:hypothetical protein
MSTTDMVSPEVSATKTAFVVLISDRLQRHNVINLIAQLQDSRTKNLAAFGHEFMAVLEFKTAPLRKNAALRPAE